MPPDYPLYVLGAVWLASQFARWAYAWVAQRQNDRRGDDERHVPVPAPLDSDRT